MNNLFSSINYVFILNIKIININNDYNIIKKKKLSDFFLKQ